MKFQLGHIVATPGAIAVFERLTALQDSPATLLHRHATGDYGELNSHDIAANDDAIRDGNRILSSYLLSDGTKVWIITEADRSVTTFLLPEEY